MRKKSLREVKPVYISRALKRDEVPLTNPSPLSFEGEGDTGGEVDRGSKEVENGTK